MNSHHEWSLASAAVDGALDVEEQILFEEHLTHCADCRRELDHMREAKALLKTAPRRFLPPALQATLEKSYGHRPPWARWTSVLLQPPRWATAGMAAAAVLGVALGWWNLMGPGRAEEQALELEPFLAAHARSAGDNGVLAGDYFNSNSSAQLAIYEDNSSR